MHLFLLVILFPGFAFAQSTCYSPSDCVVPQYCSSLEDGIIPGHCTVKEKPIPPSPPPPPKAQIIPVKEETSPPAREEPKPKEHVATFIEVPKKILPTVTPQKSQWEKTLEREEWGYTEPIIRPSGIWGPNTISLKSEDIGMNMLLAFLLFLVIGVSSVTFNNIVEGYGDHINAFFHRLPILRWFRESGQQGTGLFRGVILLLTIIVYAAIAAHITPQFILWSVQSWGILLVTFIAIALGTYTKDLWRYAVALSWKCEGLFKPNIFGLVLAVGCIALSRMLEISPGFIFGIPIGLFIYGQKFEEQEGKLEFWGLILMFTTALISWALIPVVQSYGVLHDLSMILYVILIEGVFLEAMPLKYLPGKAIMDWKKPLWILLMVMILFVLLHTIFNPGSVVSSIQHAKLQGAAVLFLGAYVGMSAILWLWLSIAKSLRS
ncbi:hypothetical protein A3D11_03880 [Candidatus Peribacteria bacterium RIFCSPHIGHO2_02_FULL_49_16]|nr:MAG: hypothetical protein A2880_04840 [Candidatus Peribacteria bacterium RIFCSPHIGHO2_01_FULL_49_38]OGJ58873.1 MAG: hypothetical protein A3D11_03880 [Candidatus Peribacteria bacterium RIFCSPHIGHO2_02_FULL_49_16]